jgi:hypothetical protein
MSKVRAKWREQWRGVIVNPGMLGTNYGGKKKDPDKLRRVYVVWDGYDTGVWCDPEMLEDA